MVVVMESDTAVVMVVAAALSLAPAWIILDCDWAGRCACDRRRMMGVLSREEILEMLKGSPPLLEDLPDIYHQVQPNGVDLTLREIAVLSSPGSLGLDNADRVISGTSPLVFDGLGRLDLPPGCYLVTYNEVVNLPRSVMALARPRSSLLRCGVSVHNAVWDAGYSGRSRSLMVVYNPQGFRIHRNTRIVQIVFFRLSREAADGYRGVFQRENT
jgi:dUTP pyrophosphatase